MPITPSPAVNRAGQLLWYLAEHPSETHAVAKLARTLGIPRATCDSILQALTQQGFVSRRGSDLSYELGASCVALASAAQASNTVLSAANRQADALSRELHASVVVTAVINDQARVVAVFDRGPASLVRARVGQAVPQVPPFGVVFAAWETDGGEAWLRRGGASAEMVDLERWSASLQFARRHGYSFSIYVPAEGQLDRLGRVLEELVEAPDSEVPRRARDELMEKVRHSDYVATHLDADAEVQLLNVTAPVFDETGRVAASMMVLGSLRPVRGSDVERLGRQLVQSADQASTQARELRMRVPGTTA